MYRIYVIGRSGRPNLRATMNTLEMARIRISRLRHEWPDKEFILIDVKGNRIG